MQDLTEVFYRQLGQLIQIKRREKSLTQEAVADSLSISRATYANLEAGDHRILLHHVLELALLLDLNLSEVSEIYSKNKLANKVAAAPDFFKEALKRIQSSSGEMRANEAQI